MSVLKTVVTDVEFGLNELVAVAIAAAGLFVKNPNTAAHASQIIGLVQDLLPALEDSVNAALQPPAVPVPAGQILTVAASSQ